MAEQTTTGFPPASTGSLPGKGRVSADEYMESHAHDHVEWVKGELVAMSPVSDRHVMLTGYFWELMRAYFALNPIGAIRQAPFVMQLDALDVRREPDLQIILDGNPGQLTPTAMIGPADICIEIVSPESTSRDHGEKVVEYEKAGVTEYWILDPIRHESRFLRLNASGVYETQLPDDQGNYQTPLLPGLKLHVPTLWLDDLPDIFTLVRSVEAMLKD